MNLKKPDEKILVVARHLLFNQTTPQGLIVTNLDAYQNSIQESKEFLWRSEMEINPEFKFAANERKKAKSAFQRQEKRRLKYEKEQAEAEKAGKKYEPKLDEEDEKSEKELNILVKEITKEMDEYKFYIVAEKLYHYFWHTFADIIIERSKKKIVENRNSDSAKSLLYIQLTTLLKLLHPFMPFVTEEIWQNLPNKKGELLMVAKWPSVI